MDKVILVDTFDLGETELRSWDELEKIVCEDTQVLERFSRNDEEHSGNIHDSFNDAMWEWAKNGFEGAYVFYGARISIQESRGPVHPVGKQDSIFIKPRRK